MKYRYFQHLCAGDDLDSERVYRWHIESRKAANAKIGFGMDGKVNTDEYVRQSRALLVSMATKGYDPAYAIPIDPDGELLGGAHRLACALALGIETVPVIGLEKRVFAPAWDANFMDDCGISREDLHRIGEDWRQMKAQRIAA